MTPTYKVKPIDALHPWEKANRQFLDAEELLNGIRNTKRETKTELGADLDD